MDRFESDLKKIGEAKWSFIFSDREKMEKLMKEAFQRKGGDDLMVAVERGARLFINELNFGRGSYIGATKTAIELFNLCNLETPYQAALEEYRCRSASAALTVLRATGRMIVMSSDTRNCRQKYRRRWH